MVQKGSLMADNTIPFPTKGNFKKNLKADAFESYLKKEGLNFFRRQDAHDSYDTVVFMTALPAGKHRLVCAVITDNSMYTLIRIHLGTAPKGPARKTFVPFLNKLNGEHASSSIWVNATKTSPAVSISRAMRQTDSRCEGDWELVTGG